MSTFMNAVTDFEREIDVIEAVMNNKVAHLSLEFDKLMLEHEENMLAIETKVLMESGTDSDLTMLYTIEAEEMKEKGGNILSRIANAIRKLFRKIRSFFTGKPVDEGNLPDKINLKDDPNAIEKDGKGLLNNIKAFLSGNKGALKGIAIGAGAVAAVTIGASAVKSTIKSMDDFAKSSEEVCADAEEKASSGNYTTEEMGLLKTALTKLQGLGNRALGVIKSIPQMKAEHDEATKQKKTEKLNEKIDNAKKNEDSVSNSISELEDKLKNVQDTIKNRENRIKVLQSESNKNDKGILGIGKSKNGKKHERFNELKSKTFLSTEEKKEYLELRKELSSNGTTNRDKTIDGYEQELEGLRKQEKKLESEIFKLSRKQDFADKKRTNAEFKASKHADAVAESVSITAELDALLESL